MSEATIDLDSSPIFHKALEHVDSSRLIPVFTKCDMAAKPESVRPPKAWNARSFPQILTPILPSRLWVSLRERISITVRWNTGGS